MKFLKYVVVSRSSSIGLFPVAVNSGFFSGWEGSFQRVVFGNIPVLYKRSHAKFMARELRRTGFCVYAVPYGLYMLRDSILHLREKLLLRQQKKAKWHK